MDSIDWKTYAQPKSRELHFIQQTLWRSQAQKATSQVTLRKLLQGGEGEARIYRSFASKGREEEQKITVNKRKLDISS